MHRLLDAALVLLLLAIISLPMRLPVQAAPDMQAPTEEPTKAPYVFPTPIFIPTYTGETAAPTGTPVRGTTPSGVKPSQGDRAYTVVQGDNPWVIAKKVYGSGAKFQAILDANGLTESSVLKVGMVLRIPATAAAGNPIPIAAPTTAPTLEPTEDVSALVPTVAAKDVTPVTVSTNPNPNSNTGVQTMAELVINILAFLFLVGSVVCGGFALVLYRRSERAKKFETLAKRVRSQ